MRRLLVVALLGLCAGAPAAADAAVVTPKPKRIVASTRLQAGPVLAGSRVAWTAFDTRPGVALFAKSRARLTRTSFDPGVGEPMTTYRLAGTPTAVAFHSALTEREIRDAHPLVHYFGSWVPDSGAVEELNQCRVREGCTFQGGEGVGATDRYVAYGPFSDRQEDRELILVHSRVATKFVDVPKIAADDGDVFRIGGRFIAYRTTKGEISVVDWRLNRIVRTLSLPRRESSAAFTFDVDRAGRVAIGRAISGARSAYGVYDQRGRLRTFPARDIESKPSTVWIDNGRVAYARTGRSGGRIWEVVTVSGQTAATMRVPAGARSLGDFDGHCFAWRRQNLLGGASIYVAATGSAPRGSICRR